MRVDSPTYETKKYGEADRESKATQHWTASEDASLCGVSFSWDRSNLRTVEGPDEVMPFLRRVTEGRNVPDDRLEEVAEHYGAVVYRWTPAMAVAYSS